MTIERLTKALLPERAAEEEAIEAAVKGFNADILTEMIERANQREYVSGLEAGTRRLIQSVIDELAEARAHDMA